MRFSTFIFGFLLLIFLKGCMTVDSISVSQIPQQSERKGRISSHASRPVILLIPFGTSYVEQAQERLIAQCPHGAIEGVLAKYQTTNYFLGLIYLAEVEMEGYCIKDGKKG
ncbi:MAG: hypothetical protein HQK54_05365 [Oligoflexales bacterium]|nr:hypothetical protein [Oligoflexales bacterium]